MENSQHDTTINRYFFLAIIILFGSALLYSLVNFFTAFLGSVMFYVLSKPLVDFLNLKMKWKKGLIAMLVITISFFIVLLPIGLLATMLYGKVATIAQNPTTIIKPIKHLGELIEEKYHINFVSNSLGGIQEFATKILSSIINTSFDFFTTISMMYFFLYFMIVSNNRMEAALMLYLPFKRSHIKTFADELKSQTLSNAVVVPLIVVVHGFLAFGAYLFLGVEDAAFWGIVTGFASVIPMVGTSLVWTPMAIYLFLRGHQWQGLFLIGWGILIIGSSDNLIRFLLAKKMANIHPIVTVLGVIIGLKYFGITGLIFGPLIISYFFILTKIYYVEYQKKK